MRAKRKFTVPAVAPLVVAACLIASTIMAISLSNSSPAAARSQQTPARRPDSPRVLVNAARFVVRRSAIVAKSGATVVVRGRLLPAVSNVEVKLMARAGSGWRTVGRSRTYRDGRFGIRYRVRSVGSTAVRVSLADVGHEARRASASVGQIVGMEPALASWYNDGGHTACGFHATFGVANRTLPCGSKVTISYRGRSVVATVDDRGPYVYGRTFDLNQNTAQYLGMYGVEQVLTSD